jgi:N-acetylmuramoyl-L-alanine amidase
MEAMSKHHIVRQGEYLLKIAAENGFSDCNPIWDHPENAELKEHRQNPNVLYPGDRLFIPDMETKEESASTEQRHRFRYDGASLQLRLRIMDFDGKPLANTACRLHIHETVHELETDSDGLIEAHIRHNAEQGLLQFDDPSLPFDVNIPIRIGYLNPINTVTGQKARLKNLGYFGGPVTDEESVEFRYAVEEFQCDFDLAVDGVCGEQTQATLKEEYGC